MPHLPALMKQLTYTERNEFLHKMGYQSYTAYLASDLWKGIRRRVFSRGRRCCLCTRFGTAVHHKFYSKSNLKGRDLKGLVPICSACHKEVEFDLGEKLCEADALTKFKRMMRAKEAQRPIRPPKPARSPISSIFGCHIDA